MREKTSGKMVVKEVSSGYLTKGSKIEVCSNEDGYQGAWFPAKIIEPPSSNSSAKRKKKNLNSNEALIQYETLLNEDETELLIEPTDMSCIRPLPPEVTDDKSFEPNDVVDACYNDAWWTGVVIKVVDDKYTVGFKNPPDLLVLGRSELRSHWIWKEGIWVRAPKERMMGSIFSPGTAVEVNFNKEHLYVAWFPATYFGELGLNSFLVQCKSPNYCNGNGLVKAIVHSHQIRPCPPLFEEKDFDLLEKVDAFHDMGWWVGEITKVLTGKRYIVTFRFTKQEKEFSHSELRPHLEWGDGRWHANIDGKWVTDFPEVRFITDYEEHSRHACDSYRNSEVAAPLECSGATNDNTEEKTPCSTNSWKGDKSPYGKAKRKLKISLKGNDDGTFATPCKKLKGGHSEDCLSFTELYERSTQVKASNEEGPVSDGKVGELDNRAIIFLKKKGRPRKSQGDSPSPRVKHERRSRPLKLPVKRSCGIEIANEDEHVMDNIESSGIRSESEVTGGSHAGKFCLLHKEEVKQQDEDGVNSEMKGKGKLPELLIEHSKDPATDCMNNIFELPGITVLELPGEKHKGTGVVAEVELPNTEVVERKGPEGAVRETETLDSAIDYLKNEVQVSVAGIPAKTSAHDQSLSLCIDETPSVKNIESTSNPARTANQQNEVRGRQVEAGGTGNIEQQDGPHWPFVKSSPVWEKIESMDVFKRLPQKPHFHPLVKCKHVCREGSAIGSMITFASLAEKTSKLQVGDPTDFIDSSLEALVELEMMGFDVKPIQNRLNKLLEMKVELGLFQNSSKEVEIQIMGCTQVSTKNNETISSIDKQIKDLQEKRAMLVSMNVIKGSEISRLQSEANAITERIQTIQRDFEKLAAAAW